MRAPNEAEVGEGHRPPLHVLHVGLLGDQPGGMAQVVNSYLRWNYENTELSAVLSTRRKHDPLAPILALLALGRVLRFRLAGRRRVAVFHLSEGGSFLREGLLLCIASRFGIPSVAHVHGAEYHEFVANHARLARFVLRRATIIAVLSDDAASTTRVLLGDSAEVAVVPNGVSVPPTCDLDAKQRRLVFGGEVGWRKGADVLAEAWSAVAEEIPEWTLVVIGPQADGRSSDWFSGLPRVTLMGSVPHEVLMGELETASVAVLPSRNEALPMFILEAMARGCAVIGSDVGGINRLISMDSGCLVRPGDAGALADAIRKLTLSSEEKARSLGAENRRYVEEHYSEVVVGRSLEAIWAHAYALDQQRVYQSANDTSERHP